MKKGGRGIGAASRIRLKAAIGRSQSTGNVLSFQRVPGEFQRPPEPIAKNTPLRRRLMSRTSSVPSASFDAQASLNKTTTLLDSYALRRESPASKNPTPLKALRRSPSKKSTNPQNPPAPLIAFHKKKKSVPILKKSQLLLTVEDDNVPELLNIPSGSKSIGRRKLSGMMQPQRPPSRTDGHHSMLSLSASEDVLPNTVVRVAFKTSTGAIAGRTKPHNQDNFLLVNDFNGIKNQRILGVFDGHGVLGHEVSGFLKMHLGAYLDRAMPRAVQINTQLPVPRDIVQMLKHSIAAGFYALNQDLIRKTQIDTSFSGSTSVIVLVRGSLLLAANIGDSRAVLGRKTSSGWQAIPLSFDHKPDNPKERERILACGGRVEPFIDPSNGTYIGPPRVWMQQEQIPGLAMSRSIGDFVAAQLGVTCEPEVIEHECSPDDKFLILASDGVWEFLPNQTVRCRQCVELVGQYWEAGDIDGACEVVVREAIASWKKEDDVVDDITILLAFLVC